MTLREQVARAIASARRVEGVCDCSEEADAAIDVFAKRIGGLPVSHNPLGTTAWVQWLDLSGVFNDES